MTMVDDEELKRKLKRQNVIGWIPFILAGALIIATFIWPTLLGSGTSSYRAMIGVVALWWMRIIETVLARANRRIVDVDATERMHALVDGSEGGNVRVDNSHAGLARVDWFREGRDVVISRKALRELSTEELDFVLASAAGPTNTRPGNDYLRRGALGLVVVIPLCLLSGALYWMHAEWAGQLVLILGTGGMVGAMFLLDARRERRCRERAIACDDAALKITRNREAAESALTKAMESAVIKTEWESRLRNVRYAEFRSMASTMPPRGWTPS